MKIYTKTGDQGETSLYGGERVQKVHPRVKAYGTVDEANSAIGFAAASTDLPGDLREMLYLVMSDLLDVGSELAAPAEDEKAVADLQTRLDSRVDEDRIYDLERFIDEAEARLPRLQTFILPTGCEAAARLHLARTHVRRAERCIVELAEQEEYVRPALIKYVNRLSDYLFVFARLVNARMGRADVPWKGKKV